MNLFKLCAFVCLSSLCLVFSQCSYAQGSWVLGSTSIASYNVNHGGVTVSGNYGTATCTFASMGSGNASANYTTVIHWSNGWPNAGTPMYSENVPFSLSGNADSGDSAQSEAYASDPAYDITKNTGTSNPYSYSLTPSPFIDNHNANFYFTLTTSIQVNSSGHSATANASATITMSQ